MRNLPPFLKILPLVVVGILLGDALAIEAWWVAVAATICTLLGYLWRKRGVGELYIALSILLWAMASTEIRTPQQTPEPSAPSEIEVIIATVPHTSGRWQQCEATTTIDNRRAKIMLRADTTATIHLGERGIAHGYLNPMPEGSYGNLMRRRGFVGTLYVTSTLNWQSLGTASSPTIAARKVQQTLSGRIDSLGLERDNGAIVKAMLLGERSDIDSSLRKAYSRAGASHILAISGLHIGIVAMVVWWLCWLLPIAGRRGHAVRNCIASLVMILYATICGLSPSVVRATLMFVVAQMALCYGTSRNTVNALCGAATVMLLFNPNNLYDISFLLSATAVAGILVGLRPTTELFGGEGGGALLRGLRSVIVVGLCSTLATLPLVAHTFSTVSLVGIFLNPIVILTAEIIVTIGLIWVSLPLDCLQPIARAIIGGAAELQNRTVEYASGLSWSAMECEVPSWIVVLAYGLMIVALVVATQYKERKIWRMRS